MDNSEYYKKLEKNLKKLDKSAQKLISTRGYTSEVENLKLLEELIKEQLRNENMRSSASTSR